MCFVALKLLFVGVFSRLVLIAGNNYKKHSSSFFAGNDWTVNYCYVLVINRIR